MRSSLLAILVCATFSGCQQPIELLEVTGQVRFHGEPLDEIVVTFATDADSTSGRLQASAVTDSAGRFALRCEDGRMGAAFGSYRVALQDLRPYRAPRNDPATARIMSRIPSKYTTVAATPLSKNVDSANHEFVIDIEP